jgi:hypothetical protein
VMLARRGQAAGVRSVGFTLGNMLSCGGECARQEDVVQAGLRPSCLRSQALVRTSMTLDVLFSICGMRHAHRWPLQS